MLISTKVVLCQVQKRFRSQQHFWCGIAVFAFMLSERREH
jgi:hypothetical protein